jgi:hypothetical protein
MKIVFICGSLEPGRDGVGDYVRRLAGWLSTQGHSIGAISLNDHHVTAETTTTQQMDEVAVQVMRIPAKWSAEKRFNRAHDLIKSLNPDWLSLQFVIFAFNARGIPVSLPRQLSAMVCGRRWHIMFHELWLGESSDDALKDKMRGWLQKRIIRHLLLQLKPTVISTSTSFFQHCLRGIGADSIKIPVFSNLPLGTVKGTKLYHQLPVVVTNTRKKYIIASFFGNVAQEAGLEDKIALLVGLTEKSGKKLMITHIGRSSNIKALFQKLETKVNALFYIHGEQSDQDIADYFRHIDLGLSTYPKILFEKSGAIASMLHNNLPVVLLRDSFIKDDARYPALSNVEDIDNLDNFTGLHQTNIRSATGISAFQVYHQIFSQPYEA